MTLRPFFSYYGGKWLKAPHYPEPQHDLIIEPFAGSAGYSVRHADRHVVLYDADPIICGVWDYLLRCNPVELNNLPNVVQNVDDLPSDCPQEARWLIGFWLNPGSAMPKRSMSKWKTFEHSNGGQLYWGRRVKERLIRQTPSIRHWIVVNSSYEEIDVDPTATWFVDPPYQNGGEHYRMKLDRGQLVRLGLWCQELQGQTIVCERSGADWLPFTDLYEGRSAKYQFSKEAVWTNNVS